MAVKARAVSSFFEKLHVDDPWLPPVPWECIPSESGGSFPATHSSSRYHLETQINQTSLSESSLVRLTMNALQGMESSLISIDKFSAIFCSESADRTAHRISSFWTWSFSTVSLGNLLKSIGHFGCIVHLLYQFVDHFNPYGNFKCRENEVSLVNQAFAVAVKKVLDGYISALNTIYDSVSLRRSVKDSNGGCLMDVANVEITLLEVYLHTEGLRTQIESLGNICCVNGIPQKFSVLSFEGLRVVAQQEFSNFPRGGGLLTYLYTHLKVSDPVHSTLLRFLFQRSFEPYYEFIRSWIYEGKIIDPYEDFVVECAENSQVFSPIESVEFPSKTFRTRDGVAIPCFIEECLRPLLRAGQQLQVVMKLVDLCSNLNESSKFYIELIPFLDDITKHSISFPTLIFQKISLENMELKRRQYYHFMLQKVENISFPSEFRSQQASSQTQQLLYAMSHGSNLKNADSVLGNSLTMPLMDKKKHKLPLDAVVDDVSSTSDESSCYEDLPESDFSSVNSEEERIESKLISNFNNDIRKPDYLSSLTFSVSSTINNEIQNPSQSDIIYFTETPSCGIRPTKSSRSENPLSLCPKESDCCIPESSRSENPSSLCPKESDCCILVSPWTAKYTPGFFCMNPVLSKRNKPEELTSGYCKQPLLPCFDFTSVNLTFGSGHNLGPVSDIIAISSKNNNKDSDYREDYGSGQKINAVVACVPSDSKVENRKVRSETSTTRGGGSWETILSRLGNMNNNVAATNYLASSEDVMEMPLDYVIGKCLREEILLQYRYVSRLTIKLLEEGFTLQEHFLALRKYHFMEIADWVDLFIMSLWQHKWYVAEADKRILEIQGILELSIQRSSCEGDCNRDRLYVYTKEDRKISLPTSAKGIHSFDFLGLGYRVEWPVTIILTPVSLNSYSNIFNFLIQIKLSEFSLTDAWCLLKNLVQMTDRCGSKIPKSSQLCISILTQTRHTLKHFVSTLQQYVQSQLSHVSWSNFFDSLKHKVKDMMDLETVHMEYLMESMQICFLTVETGHIRSIIQTMLQIAVEFRTCLVGYGLGSVSNGQDCLDDLNRIDIAQVLSIKEKFIKSLNDLFVLNLKSPKHSKYGVSNLWDYLNSNNYYSDIIVKRYGHTLYP